MNKLRLLTFLAADDHSGGSAAPVVHPVTEPTEAPASKPIADPASEPVPDAGAAAAEPAKEPAKEPAPEPAKEEAPRTLKAATAMLGEARASMADITNQLALVRGERDQLKGQFEAAVAEATGFKAELATLRTELEGAVAARTTAEERAVKADENSARLEQLCSVRGVDPSAAVTGSDDAPTSVSSKEELLKQYASIKDPTARAAFWKANEAALLA